MQVVQQQRLVDVGRQAPVRLGDDVDRRGSTPPTRGARSSPRRRRPRGSSASPVAVDVGQRGETEAQVVDAEAPLLALELRLEVATVRDGCAGPSRERPAPGAPAPPPGPVASGAIASSSASAISATSRGRRAGVPFSRSGTGAPLRDALGEGRRRAPGRERGAGSRSPRRRGARPRSASAPSRTRIAAQVVFAQALQASPPRSARRSCRAPAARPRRSGGRRCARVAPRVT